MHGSGIAILFPGQGAFDGKAIAEVYQNFPQTRAIFSEIDAVAKNHLRASVSELLFRPGGSPPIEELLANAPDVLQLGIYGLSVATYKILEAQGLEPAVLVGHSFGEIAALVCGGAFSVREGAEIVCHRIAAVSALGERSGYMAALGTDAATAQKIVDLAGKDLAVAVENHESQTVVAGSEADMAAVEEVARALRVFFKRLNSPYPFHCPPIMGPVRSDFAAGMQHLAPDRLRVPVYSPILGRYYNDGDVLTERLAEHLVRPVAFSRAVEQLHAEGIGVFLECGALDALSKLVKTTLGSRPVSVLAALDPNRAAARSLEEAMRSLEELGLLSRKRSHAADALVERPHPEAGDFEAFWAAHGERVLNYIHHEFVAWAKHAPAPAGEAHAAPPPPEVVYARPRAVEETPAKEAAPAGEGGRPAPSAAKTRAELFSEVTALFAEALEYPEEVFTEEVQLEAELGIDSVKQTELLARVIQRYELPPRPADFRLSDYSTMGKIVDFVYAALPRQASPVGAASANGAGVPAHR